MQPPRRRSPRFNFRSTRMLRSIILNTTAALATLLVARLASLLVSESSEPMVPRVVEMVTNPLAWPFRQMPLLDTPLARQALVADVVIVLLVFLIGLLAAGVVTGWREPTSRRAYRSRPFG